MQRFLLLLCLAFLVFHVDAIPAVAQTATTAELTLQSDPGDFIGGGGNFSITYTPQSGAFSAQVRRTVGGLPAELLFVMGTVTSGRDNTFALLFFGTDQLGIPIQPGVYPNAQRADFASPGHPGLDISFQNRACNTVTGSFTVDNVTFSGPNTIATFSASFEQHCEGAAPALRGKFAYGPSAIAFSAFFALVGIDAPSGSFNFQSTFVLGSGGSIDPLSQDVTFQLGGFTVKIPAGSFQQQGAGDFAFQGTINGVALNAEVSSLGGGGFSFQLEGAGVPTLPCGNPVMVKLTIGNNTGTLSATADF